MKYSRGAVGDRQISWARGELSRDLSARFTFHFGEALRIMLEGGAMGLERTLPLPYNIYPQLASGTVPFDVLK